MLEPILDPRLDGVDMPPCDCHHDYHELGVHRPGHAPEPSPPRPATPVLQPVG